MSEEDDKIIAQLEAQVAAEKANHSSLVVRARTKDEEIRRLKCNTVHLQAKVEEEEEFIINNLLKRLETVKKEKENLARQVESEEQFIQNDMQRRLDQLRNEKVELQRHLDAEQEYFVNKLQKQLLELTSQKNALDRKLNEGRSGIISKLEQSVGDYKEALNASSSCPQQIGVVSNLEGQVRRMRKHQEEVGKQSHEYQLRCDSLVKQLEELSTEKFILEAKTRRFEEKLSELQNEREAEFAQFELVEERTFNEHLRAEDERRAKCPNSGSRQSSKCPTPGSRSESLSRCGSMLQEQRRGIPSHMSQRFPGIHSSCPSSDRSSPGTSSCATPPASPSPYKCSMPNSKELTQAHHNLKRHTEDVLHMSPHLPPPSPQRVPTTPAEIDCNPAVLQL